MLELDKIVAPFQSSAMTPEQQAAEFKKAYDSWPEEMKKQWNEGIIDASKKIAEMVDAQLIAEAPKFLRKQQ